MIKTIDNMNNYVITQFKLLLGLIIAFLLKKEIEF